MTRSSQYQVLLLAVISIAAWTFLFPALNWPDEIYKLHRLQHDTHLYARLLSFFGPSECNVQTLPTGAKSYGSNSLHVATIGPLGCYYAFKALNLILFIAIVITGYCLLRKRAGQSSFLLSMIWPSIVFYSSSINQQTVFVAVSCFLVARTLDSKRVWPALLVAVPLVLIDRSFVALVVFLAILSALKVRPRAAIPVLMVVIAAIYLLRPYILGYSSAYLLSADTSFNDLSEQLSRFQDPLYVSVALFAISFVYLGGTNSLLGIGFDYALVYLFFLYSVSKTRYRTTEIQVYFFALGLAFVLVVGVVPTLQVFRYYVFIMPAVLYFFVNTAERRKIYMVYSLSMSAIYLFLSNVLSI